MSVNVEHVGFNEEHVVLHVNGTNGVNVWVKKDVLLGILEIYRVQKHAR